MHWIGAPIRLWQPIVVLKNFVLYLGMRWGWSHVSALRQRYELKDMVHLAIGESCVRQLATREDLPHQDPVAPNI